jgi:predicted metal-binding protein
MTSHKEAKDAVSPKMKTKSLLGGFVQRACDLGAIEAKVIRADSVVTAPWVRLKCQFGCGGWGSNLCCPPHTPTPEETSKVIACYQQALLIHCQGNKRPTKIAAALEREIFLSGFYKALGFGAGPCRLCKDCNLEGCIRPDDARPAMEACGIDVFATARANGFPIEVVKDASCEDNYYGLVLIE